MKRTVLLLSGIFLLVSAVAFHYVKKDFDLSFYAQKLRFEQKIKELRNRAYLRYSNAMEWGELKY